MIRTGSSSFYKAFSFLPSPKREAVHVIYAFCRMIDNAVDEPEHSPYTLQELEQRFIKLDQAAGHFIWPALRWLFDSYPLTKEPFFRQMEGQRRDLSFTQYESMAQLEQYCYLVAGTVGEMLLPVLHDSPTEKVIESGICLCKAMQIVNIVRDIGEDRSRGRRYIPIELMMRHRYSEAAFERGEINDAFRSMIRELDSLARSWFEVGLRDIESYPEESAFSVELAASFYRAILDKVEGNHYEVYRRRAVVGPVAKLEIYLSVKAKHALQLSGENGVVC